jgi:hypothetical protein
LKTPSFETKLVQPKELIFFFLKNNIPKKNRFFLKNFYKIFFFFSQSNLDILNIVNNIFFQNLYTIRYIRLVAKKKHKNPLIAAALAQKKQLTLTFKKSLSLLKHLFNTLFRLGRFFFDVKAKNQFVLTFFFYLTSKKNLFFIYKTSLYLTK